MVPCSRRGALRRGGALLAAAAVAGCVGHPAPGSPSRTPTGEDPTHTSPRTQFQYDAEHTGAADSSIPEPIVGRWQSRHRQVEGGLAVADGRVLVATGGSLYALDTTDGAELWRSPAGAGGAAPPAVTADTAYVTAAPAGDAVDGGVAAIDLSDGSVRWRAIPDVDVASAPTLANDRVYVGGAIDSSSVVAIDATSGEEDWRFDAGQYASTPTVANGTVFVGGGEDVAVYALDATDGSKTWHREVDGPVWGAPTVADGTVFVGTRTGSVYAVDPSDGGVRWRTRVGSDVRESLAVADGQVYAPDDGEIHALSTDGVTRWSADATGFVYAPTVAGTAVVCTDRQQGFCLDAATGDRRWTHHVSDRQEGDAVYTGVVCPPVVADGVVYVGDYAGTVYALRFHR